MQTKKMSLANVQGKMSRSEMKGIMAGYVKKCTCTCNGSVGAWEYTTNPSPTTILNDISLYCSSNSAGCTGCDNNPS
jgi:hypothetical protein